MRVYYKVQFAALRFSIVFRFILFRVPSIFFVIHPPGNRHQLFNITRCSYMRILYYIEDGSAIVPFSRNRSLVFFYINILLNYIIGINDIVFSNLGYGTKLIL